MPGEFHLDYILLPVGYMYNRTWRQAKKGDMILFPEGEGVIDCVRPMRLAAPETDILARMRYGVSIKRCFQIWQQNAVVEGNGKQAVSTDECLWVIYKKRYEGDIEV